MYSKNKKPTSDTIYKKTIIPPKPAMSPTAKKSKTNLNSNSSININPLNLSTIPKLSINANNNKPISEFVLQENTFKGNHSISDIITSLLNEVKSAQKYDKSIDSFTSIIDQLFSLFNSLILFYNQLSLNMKNKTNYDNLISRTKVTITNEIASLLDGINIYKNENVVHEINYDQLTIENINAFTIDSSITPVSTLNNDFYYEISNENIIEKIKNKIKGNNSNSNTNNNLENNLNTMTSNNYYNSDYIDYANNSNPNNYYRNINQNLLNVNNNFFTYNRMMLNKKNTKSVESQLKINTNFSSNFYSDSVSSNRKKNRSNFASDYIEMSNNSNSKNKKILIKRRTKREQFDTIMNEINSSSFKKKYKKVKKKKNQNDEKKKDDEDIDRDFLNSVIMTKNGHCIRPTKYAAYYLSKSIGVINEYNKQKNIKSDKGGKDKYKTSNSSFCSENIHTLASNKK